MRKLIVALIVAGSTLVGTLGAALAMSIPASSQGQASSPIAGAVACNLSSGITDTVMLYGTPGQAVVSVEQICSANAPSPPAP